MTVPLRAALYLRVWTARQAEHDVSIPDQRRQGEAYCTSRGYQLVETYVEPGASATNDRRPEFQHMIEAGTAKPASFDVIVVHSFSRFFRDHFELEFYVRKLSKLCQQPYIRLVDWLGKLPCIGLFASLQPPRAPRAPEEARKPVVLPAFRMAILSALPILQWVAQLARLRSPIWTTFPIFLGSQYAAQASINLRRFSSASLRR
jgi:Resolvase, N terminal domain